ncbi:MAG: hypothetical protein EAZ42_01495 [Verrucomicrobia bacterium]|nr:MAG: hypothetical protein EAZ42_01495 [Verrucomicrobiota bacterium]
MAWAENGGAVRRSGGALLFECCDARTAELISACKELSSICYRVGNTSLVIREEGLPKFQKQVRTLGFGIR